MKLAVILLFGLISLKACSNRDAMIMDITEIRYTAATRGYYYQVQVSPMVMQIRMDRNTAEELVYRVDAENWDALLALIEDIDLKKLESLKGITELQAVDRSAYATLRVFTTDKQFQSTPFDHGNPPEEIKPLVDALLELAENSVNE